MARNGKNLHEAKVNVNDEYYTCFEDVEKECIKYKSQYYGKTIYCNCDDPLQSNFFRFFAENFNIFKLKKLICTCYNKGVTGIGENMRLEWLDEPIENQTYGVKSCPNKAFKIVLTELTDFNGDERINGQDVIDMIKHDLETGEHKIVTFLEGNGDFRSDECIELLKESDIVVTNPPFSLFREFISLLMEYNKKFIIIGNKNALTYKEVFSYIKDNKLWLGYESPTKFLTPSGELTNQVSGLCRWFTNLDVRKRHEDLYLSEMNTYNPEKYPTYDNYDAINVDSVNNIPSDYFGVMGVPITFLDKYNPNQFEIIDGINRYAILNVFNRNEQIRENHAHGCDIKGVPTYFRILIRRKQ